MNVLQKCLVGLVFASSVGGCVAAECRDGSHEEGGKCVADDAGEGGSSGSAGTAGSAAGQGGSAGTAGQGATSGSAGESGSGGVAGDEDAGLDLDAGIVVDSGTEPRVCNAGFEPDGLGGCRDIDECLSNSDDCDVLTTCVNYTGGYDCTACPMGYGGTGVSGCVETDECANGTDDCTNTPPAICTNTIGAYSCACPAGFEGHAIGPYGCGDIDECISNNGGCETQPMVECTNTNGGRVCGACPSGYVGNGVGNNGCRDINECLTNNGGCDAAAQCTNTNGGRMCGACPAGYAGDGAQVDGCVPQLATLRVTPGLVETFAPGTIAYSAVVGPLASYLEVVATTPIPNAVIAVVGQNVDTYGSRLIRIGSAASSVPVAITDPYGRTTTYTITVTREGLALQRAYVKPASPTDSQYLSFGLKVAMSGDTLAVSRRSPGLYGGAVEIYVRNGGSWSHQATLDPYVESGAPARLSNGFGQSGLDLDGDTLAVGESGLAVPNGVTTGGVQVYVRNGATWTHQATLYPAVGSSGDKFGQSVAVSGDRIAVGAPDEDGNGVGGPSNDSVSEAGSAYVFARAGGAWTQEAYVKAAAPGAGDRFGFDVDLHRSTLLIGAPYEDGSGADQNPPVDEGRIDSGALYISTRDESSGWSAPLYIKSSESTSVVNASLGYAVALGSEDTLVATAPGQPSSGAAIVFRRATPGTWSFARLMNSGDSDADNFGLSVDMWSPGAFIVSAASDDSTNSVVNGTVNDNGDNNGAAYVFVSSSPIWGSATRLQIKTRNNEAGDGIQGSSGTSVAIFGDTVVMTAPGEDSSANGIQTPGPTQIEDIDTSLSYSGGAAYTFR